MGCSGRRRPKGDGGGSPVNQEKPQHLGTEGATSSRCPSPAPPSLTCLHVRFSRPHEVGTVVPPSFTDWPGITQLAEAEVDSDLGLAESRILRGGTRTHTHTCSLPPWRTAAWWGAGLALGCPLGGLPSITGSPASWPPCTSGAQQVSPASCQCFLSPLSHRRWGPFLWKPQESSLASTSWKNMMPEGAVLGAGRGGRCADARPVRLAFEPGLALHHPHLP